MSNPAEKQAYERCLQGGGLANLSARTKLRISGADRVRYLNGQVTANVKALPPGRAIPACVTSAKGKLNAEVCVCASADALFLDADTAVREELVTRLERYVVADDVVIEDVTDQWGLFHGVKPRGSVDDAVLAPALALPDVRSVKSVRLGAQGMDFWMPYSSQDGVVEALHAMEHMYAELWETFRVEAGIPAWGSELTPETLPPEAGLDRTHIDYHKGCYIGQEVISRIRSVGHVNRLLSGFSASDDSAIRLSAGAILKATDAAESAVVGKITTVAWSFALEKRIALGYLRRGTEATTLFAHSPTEEGGPPVALQVHTIPFLPSP